MANQSTFRSPATDAKIRGPDPDHLTISPHSPVSESPITVPCVLGICGIHIHVDVRIHRTRLGSISDRKGMRMKLFTGNMSLLAFFIIGLMLFILSTRFPSVSMDAEVLSDQ